MTEDEIQDCVRKAVAEELEGQLPEKLGEVLAPVIRSAVHDYIKLDVVRTMVKEVNAPFKKAIFAGLAVLALACAIAIKGNSDQTRDIQESRKIAAKSACEDQNTRHDHTIAQLDKAFAPRLKAASPTQAAAILERRAQTVLLIEALAPKQDCAQLIKQRIEQK